MRALIMDSDQRMRRQMAQFLGSSSFDSVEATDGISALRFAHAHAIDLIIADIDLRDLDALQLLRIIRDGAFGSTPPPVIVCSATLNDEIWFLHPALEGLTQLAKPFTPIGFAAALNLAFPVA
jgi:DNA-binding response OmpR family regulator